MAVSPESIMQLAEHAKQKHGTFIMNLSAPFVSQFYSEPLAKILPYVDVLFGNESVSMTLGKLVSMSPAPTKWVNSLEHLHAKKTYEFN